jgi:hypothetical protein
MQRPDRQRMLQLIMERTDDRVSMLRTQIAALDRMV